MTEKNSRYCWYLGKLQESRLKFYMGFGCHISGIPNTVIDQTLVEECKAKPIPIWIACGKPIRLLFPYKCPLEGTNTIILVKTEAQIAKP